MTVEINLKRIAELESACDETQELLDKQIEVTYKLDKENAELRHQLNKNPCVCNTEWHCNDCLEQFTKAKEIIKRYVKIYVNPYPEEEIELRNEAEQFLKVLKGCEVEK